MRVGFRSLRASIVLALRALAGIPSSAATQPPTAGSDLRAVRARAPRTQLRTGQPANAANPHTLRPPVTPSVVNPAVAFFTLAPCRVFDSRLPADAPALSTGVARSIQVTGACGVLAAAKMVAVNLTATHATAAGSIELYRGDGSAAGLADLPFAAE